LHSTRRSFKDQRANFSRFSVHRAENRFSAGTVSWQRTNPHNFVAQLNPRDGGPAVAGGDPGHEVLTVP
jgi:hypothetical protein